MEIWKVHQHVSSITWLIIVKVIYPVKVTYSEVKPPPLQQSLVSERHHVTNSSNQGPGYIQPLAHSDVTLAESSHLDKHLLSFYPRYTYINVSVSRKTRRTLPLFSYPALTQDVFIYLFVYLFIYQGKV